jgi:hypothetical protein
MDGLKVRENRLRRAARRQGLLLSKSARRDKQAIDYALWLIWDGQGSRPPYTLDLDQLERVLAKRKR